MKKLQIFLILPLLFSINAYSQDLEGRKIVNADLNLLILKNNGDAVSQFNTTLLYGKIKPNNTYLSYGFKLGFTHNLENQPSMFALGPAIETGKFVKLVDKLYLSPYLGGSVQGVSIDGFGVNLSGYAIPIRFLYDFSNHFMLSASFGSASMNLNLNSQYTIFSLNGSLTNNSGIGVFYSFK